MNSLYKVNAEKAAMLEQCFEYNKAARHWELASKVADNRINRQWTLDRIDFCLKVEARLARLTPADKLNQYMSKPY